MDTGMMPLTYLDGSGVRVLWVDVVAVDQPTAGAGGIPKQMLNDALGARKLAPPLGVVDRSVHDRSLPITVPIHSASVQIIMARPTEPAAVHGHITTASRLEDGVMHVGACASFASLTRLTKMV